MSITTLRESGEAKGTGKRWTAKLLAADVWGTSAFYPAEVLARDAATAFPVGTKMFENHLTESEIYERPVGDVNKLVGKLITAGEFIADHPEGAGVYADVEFYDSYVPRISEIGDDVGLSVDGGADYVEGERDQRFGKIVTGIPFIRSVDVVVAAGAGGKLVTIKESAGPMAGVPVNTEGVQPVAEITKEDLAAQFKTLGETLTTAIKESLVPTPVEGVAPVTEPVVPAALSAEDIAAAVTAAQAATTVETPAAEVKKTEEVTVDVAALVAEIKQQTTIREAFLAQADPTNLRIVESARGKGEAPLGASILDIMNKK